MNKNESTYITVGKVGAPYGVHGWIKIRAYTEFGPDILDYKPWYISTTDDNHKEIKLEDGKIYGNGIIVKFANIQNPESAALLTGKTISILRSQLPELKKDEFYWTDLVGLTVINKDGTVYGQVAYLIATGSNDVLVVKGDKEHAIPYLVGEVVLNIDLEKKEILVDWELI